MDTEKTPGSEAHPPTPTRWQIAVHEAAHAACAHRQGIAVPYVTINGIVAVEKGNESGGSLGCCYYSADGEGQLAPLVWCALSLVGPLAGLRAVRHDGALMLYPEFLQAAEDWNPNSDAGIVLYWLRSVGDPEALYEAARKEAEAFVEDHWAEIIALAERLMEKETLGASGVSAVLGPGWFEFREMLREMAYEDDLAPWVKAAGGIENAEPD